MTIEGSRIPPKKGTLVNLKDDDDSDDAQMGGRNKESPDERKCKIAIF